MAGVRKEVFCFRTLRASFSSRCCRKALSTIDSGRRGARRDICSRTYSAACKADVRRDC